MRGLAAWRPRQPRLTCDLWDIEAQRLTSPPGRGYGTVICRERRNRAGRSLNVRILTVAERVICCSENAERCLGLSFVMIISR